MKSQRFAERGGVDVDFRWQKGGELGEGGAQQNGFGRVARGAQCVLGGEESEQFDFVELNWRQLPARLAISKTAAFTIKEERRVELVAQDAQVTFDGALVAFKKFGQRAQGRVAACADLFVNQFEPDVCSCMDAVCSVAAVVLRSAIS
ncbi:MAG: hypothetical protein QOC61_712 [Acidobacteriota bacterium]|nr:hypothetical protein [Acidobacteriota bacterium]